MNHFPIALILVITAWINLCGGQTVREAAPVPDAPLQIQPAIIDVQTAENTPPAAAPQPENRLSVADVVASVYRWYPEIVEARQAASVARGNYIEAYGAFDTKLQAYSLTEPTGFYETYRQGIGAVRRTWWGGYLAAGYRLGRGNFAPWYLERETNRGGEFKVALAQPLLRGRAIDPQRVAIFSASLARQAADPWVLQSILDASRDASNLYWQWVAAGAVFEAQKELLELAARRGEQFEVGFKAGKFAEIDLVLNRQLIAERRAKVIESQQKYQSATIKLSLYLRDETSRPLIAVDQWLPQHFPRIDTDQLPELQAGIAQAFESRPETRLLDFQLRQLDLERRLACNQMMPNIDLIAEASQDVGEPTSSKRDKSEFELLFGLQAELPLQRRKARGKIQATLAKINQVNQKLKLQRDKIAVEVQTFHNAVQLSSQVVGQSQRSLLAALDALNRYRFAFDKGKADLIYLNIFEMKANETEIKLVEAQRNWFIAIANLQRAMGLDPLDASMRIASLPESPNPGPGHLPALEPVNPQAFEKDWQQHQLPKDQ